MTTLAFAPESPWIEALYLDKVPVLFTLRNTGGDTVIIHSIEGYIWFPPAQPDLPPERFPFPAESAQHRLEPGESTTVIVHIRAPLAVQSGTNNVALEVMYQALRDGRFRPRASSVLPRNACCVIVKNREMTAKRVFISHKIPEDSESARLLQEMLRRAGIQGYMAEDDPRFDVNLWREKLPDAIRDSDFTAALWTAYAQAAPEAGVQREIAISDAHDVPVALLRELGVPLPRGFDQNREWQDLAIENLNASLARAAETLWREMKL